MGEFPDMAQLADRDITEKEKRYDNWLSEQTKELYEELTDGLDGFIYEYELDYKEMPKDIIDATIRKVLKEYVEQN